MTTDYRYFGAITNFNGKRLRQARELQGYTVEDLADDTGQLPAYIQLLEAGKTQPEATLIEKFSRLLDFPVKFFFKPDPPKFDVNSGSFAVHFGPLGADEL